ncbi:hypothetical protein MUK42_17339 [Musa troglodytarum]|uniref:Uncharacterized protein n=1 Tax=Musa troglodytarum TaxID=320322 RepID=A0A9E7HWB9_9LILI|nr:hypothetical protein MUK42_17339 [Musa troglodytarum]
MDGLVTPDKCGSDDGAPDPRGMAERRGDDGGGGRWRLAERRQSRRRDSSDQDGVAGIDDTVMHTYVLWYGHHHSFPIADLEE